MRVLSIEWSRFGIKLNAIAAGQFATETLPFAAPDDGRPLAEARRPKPPST